MSIPVIIIISVVVGLIAGLIFTGGMRAELHSVSKATEAQAYIKDGSMKLNVNKDLFLYKKLERTARPKQTTQTTQENNTAK